MKSTQMMLLLAMASSVHGQVISRRTPAPQDNEVPAVTLESWSKPLQMAWAASANIQNDAILGKLRFSIAENLLGHRMAQQAEAVALQIPEAFTRYHCLGAIALHHAKMGEEEEGRRLIRAAAPGLKVTVSGSYNQLILALVKAAAALPDPGLAKQLQNKIGDADTRFAALGARVAAMDPPDDEKDTFPELDELTTPSQETSAITRIYQAQAVLDVARAWRSHKPPISNERLLALSQKSIQLASTSMVSQLQHRLAVLELLDPKVFGPARAEILDEARQIAASQRESYEYTPADLIRLGFLETAGNEKPHPSVDWKKAALTLIEGMSEDAKLEARLLAGAALLEQKDWKTASTVWTAAINALSSNPNPNVIAGAVAGICLHVDRLGVQSEVSFWEPLQRQLDEHINGSP